MTECVWVLDRVMLQVAVQQVTAGWSACHWRAGVVTWAPVAAVGSPVWWQRHLEADSWTTTGMSCTDSHILTSMKELIQYNTILYNAYLCSAKGRMWIGGAEGQWTMLCTVGDREPVLFVLVDAATAYWHWHLFHALGKFCENQRKACGLSAIIRHCVLSVGSVSDYTGSHTCSWTFDTVNWLLADCWLVLSSVAVS